MVKTPKKKTTNQFIKIIAPIIIGTFGVAAIFIAKSLFLSFLYTVQARDWISVPVQLLTWRVTTSSGTISRAGSIKNLEEIQATYLVKIDNKVWESTRVTLVPINDNFSDGLRRDIRHRLEAAEIKGGVLSAWVDPNTVGASVIDRRLPIASCIFQAVIFIFPCGLATIFIITYLLRGLEQIGIKQATKYAVPFWAIFHSLPVLPIIMLSDPEQLDITQMAILSVLAVIGVVGWIRFVMLALKGDSSLSSIPNSQIH